MIRKTPERFKAESKKLCEGWASREDDMSMGEYVELYASPEYLKYHRESVAHLQEMQDKGILV